MTTHTIKAVRLSPNAREIEGMSCPCGGTLIIQREQPVRDRQWTWEVYCGSCMECDPNGYSSVRKCLEAALEFWK